MTPLATMKMNPLDLAEILEEEGYAIDEDSGEVYTDPESKRGLLLTLAATGNLKVKHDAMFKLGFYIPYWNCYHSFDSYCQEFPHEQQCKCYDV